MGDRLRGVRFLIRDQDSKFSGPFDEVFRTEGGRIVKTPIRSPKANAFAERWVRTARRECLDHLLILGRRHLERTLREFVGHYNAGRPHRGLQLACPSQPTSRTPSGTVGPVGRRDQLGGLIHEYFIGVQRDAGYVHPSGSPDSARSLLRTRGSNPERPPLNFGGLASVWFGPGHPGSFDGQARPWFCG